MIKNIFLAAILISVMHLHAMEKECSIVPHFPRDVWTKIAQYMVALHYESDEECIKRTAQPSPIHLPEKYKECISSGNLYCVNAPEKKAVSALEKDYPGYLFAESPDKNKCAIWGPLTTENDIFKLLVIDMDKKKEVIDRSPGTGKWIRQARLIWFNMHKVSLSPSGNVLGLLMYAGYLGEDCYDHDITFVDAKSEKNINAMPRYCVDGRPLAIHFNLQGTKVVVHTEKECFVHSLDEKVRKLSMIKDVSHIKMLILQNFFDQ